MVIAVGAGCGDADRAIVLGDGPATVGAAISRAGWMGLGAWARRSGITCDAQGERGDKTQEIAHEVLSSHISSIRFISSHT